MTSLGRWTVATRTFNLTDLLMFWIHVKCNQPLTARHVTFPQLYIIPQGRIPKPLPNQSGRPGDCKPADHHPPENSGLHHRRDVRGVSDRPSLDVSRVACRMKINKGACGKSRLYRGQPKGLEVRTLLLRGFTIFCD